jgi:hypothetical protein
MKHTRLIKHVVEDTDRHGNVRIYFRRKGHPKVRLPSPVGSPEFEAAYAAALEGKVARVSVLGGGIQTTPEWLSRMALGTVLH